MVPDEIDTFVLTPPNREQRRRFSRFPGMVRPLVSPTAAKRRKVRRSIARRSTARNRAR